jgi:6-phosphogluconolactonase (cycloisomerase 2 family)
MHLRLRRIIFSALAITLLTLGALATTAGAQDRSLYATQQFNEGVQWFSMNVETGALTLNGPLTPSGALPAVPGITPNGQQLYVPAYDDDEIHAFSIGSGAPSEISGSPFTAGTNPNAAIPSTSGSALWSADYIGGTVSGFGIGGSGALTPATGSPFTATGNPTTIAVSPHNSLLYTPDLSGQAISGFSTSADGGLTPLSGFPLTDLGNPIDAEFSVSGETLFILNYNQSIASYSVNQQTGALTEIAGSPVNFSGSAPAALAASPDGKFLFAADNGTNTLLSFAIGANGSLTPVDSISTDGMAFDAAVSPNSRFVYTSDYTHGTIHGFAIAADGSLSELATSPYGDQSGPLFSFAIVPDQGPAAAFNSNISYVSTLNVDAGASSDTDGSVSTYQWNFGDGSSPVTATSPQSSHTFNRGGTFTVSLVVTDNENCSDQQVGTGQTLACNGSSAARTSQTVTIPPLTLKFPSAKQIKSTKSKGKTVLRVQVQSFLDRNASISYQFQKSKKGGACRKHTTTHKHKPSFKNFGKSSSASGANGRNLKTFAGKFGGKKIVPGRYRVILKAKDQAGESAGPATSASFCVR